MTELTTVRKTHPRSRTGSSGNTHRDGIKGNTLAMSPPREDEHDQPGDLPPRRDRSDRAGDRALRAETPCCAKTRNAGRGTWVVRGLPSCLGYFMETLRPTLTSIRSRCHMVRGPTSSSRSSRGPSIPTGPSRRTTREALSTGDRAAHLPLRVAEEGKPGNRLTSLQRERPDNAAPKLIAPSPASLPNDLRHRSWDDPTRILTM